MQQFLAWDPSISYMHKLVPSEGPPRPATPRPTVAARPTPPPANASVDNASTDSGAIVERALHVAYRTALGVTRDPHLAADVAQEVAIKALDHIDGLRDPKALDGWLHRVTVRTAIDEHRKANTRRTAEDGFNETEPVAHHDSPADPQALLRILGTLPDRQRAAVTLRYVHDQSDRQIARALGCRTGTVRSLLSRAIATLRAQLDNPTQTKAPR